MSPISSKQRPALACSKRPRRKDCAPVKRALVPEKLRFEQVLGIAAVLIAMKGLSARGL